MVGTVLLPTSGCPRVAAPHYDFVGGSWLEDLIAIGEIPCLRQYVFLRISSDSKLSRSVAGTEKVWGLGGVRPEVVRVLDFLWGDGHDVDN